MRKIIKRTLITFAFLAGILICNGCEADAMKQKEQYQAEENGILFLADAGYQVFAEGELVEDMETIYTYLESHNVTIDDVNKQIIFTTR